MKVLLKKKVGDLELEIEAEGRDEKDIFPQLEFWTSLPLAHPDGATDFQFRARPAQTREGKKVKYYEITCLSADQRFCFGQATDEAGGGLFPKGWEPIYHGNDYEGDDRQPEPPRETRQQPTKQQSAQTGNQGVDNAIRAEFQRLGVNNPGQEKTIVMKALKSRTGLLVAELDVMEKADLLEALRAMEISVGRAA